MARKQQYVVVIKNKDGDWEPLHPGTVDSYNASRALQVAQRCGTTAERWTHEKWEEYDSQIRDELFCPECGEERDRCACNYGEEGRR